MCSAGGTDLFLKSAVGKVRGEKSSAVLSHAMRGKWFVFMASIFPKGKPPYRGVESRCTYENYLNFLFWMLHIITKLLRLEGISQDDLVQPLVKQGQIWQVVQDCV